MNPVEIAIVVFRGLALLIDALVSFNRPPVLPPEPPPSAYVITVDEAARWPVDEDW